MNPIPETAALPDWPRKVARAVNDAMRKIAELAGFGPRIDALEAVTDWAALADFADDMAAAAGGVAVGRLYRTGSILKVRVS